MRTACIAVLLLPVVASFVLGPAPRASSRRRRSSLSMSLRQQDYVVRPRIVIRRHEWQPVLRTIDLALSDVIPVESEGQDMLIVSDGKGGVHCTDMWSPFLGAPLYDAEVKDGTIICPLSGSAFDLETGELVGEWCPFPPVLGPMVMSRLCPPRKLRVYPTRITGRMVEVFVRRNLAAVTEPAPGEGGFLRALLEALDFLFNGDV